MSTCANCTYICNFEACDCATLPSGVASGSAAYAFNAALFLDLQRKIHRGDLNAQSALKQIVGGVLGLVPNAVGAVIETEIDGYLVYQAASGMMAEKVGLHVSKHGSLGGLTLDSRRPIMCSDTWSDPRVDRVACERMGVRSMMTVPLCVSDKPVGVLKVASPQADAFGCGDLVCAELLAGLASFALTEEAKREQHQENERLDRRFRATFDQAAVGIAHIDLTGRFLLVNDRFCSIAGYSAAELHERTFQSITHPDDVEEDQSLINALLGFRIANYVLDKRYLREDGKVQWVRMSVSLVRDRQHRPDFFVAIIEDINAQKVARDETLTDPLTRLPSQAWLEAALPDALSSAAVSKAALGVCFVDLDKLKRLNDAHGYHVGDSCLVATARAIRSTVGPYGKVARLAGDEFAVLLRDTTKNELADCAYRIIHAIESMAHQQRWLITASVGSVLVPPGSTKTSADVLRQADRMMYLAKADPTQHCMTVGKTSQAWVG